MQRSRAAWVLRPPAPPARQRTAPAAWACAARCPPGTATASWARPRHGCHRARPAEGASGGRSCVHGPRHHAHGRTGVTMQGHLATVRAARTQRQPIRDGAPPRSPPPCAHRRYRSFQGSCCCAWKYALNRIDAAPVSRACGQARTGARYGQDRRPREHHWGRFPDRADSPNGKPPNLARVRVDGPSRGARCGRPGEGVH